MSALRRLRLGTRFTIVLLGFFLISIGLSGLALYRALRTTAEESVTSNGLLLLHTMNAVRTYTSSQVNPLLVPVMDAQGKFIPETVPAFSARSVFDKLRGDEPYQNFFYKEASTNPTAPQDRADEWETEVLNRFRNDPKLTSESGFRTLNGQLVFYNARPMVVSSPACLSCHTTPETAPPAMVERYGPLNGFGWKLGSVIAAQVVYVPAIEVYQRSWRTWLSVMVISVTSFALAVLAINLTLRRSVVRPVATMAELANQISNDEIGEAGPDVLAGVAQRSDELGQMARVFQRMAQEVYAREQALKLQVEELRIEIDEAKKARQVAELVDTESFQSLRARAHTLREQHRTLGGAGASPMAGAEHAELPEASGSEDQQGREQPTEKPTAQAETGPEALADANDQGQPRPPQDQGYPGWPSHEDASDEHPSGAADPHASDASQAAYEALRQQLTDLEPVNGITPLDILTLPAALQEPIRNMLKRGVSPEELAVELALSEGRARQIADLLIGKGILEREDVPQNGTIYKAHLARVHPRRVPPEL